MHDAVNPVIPPPPPAFNAGNLAPDETTMACLAHVLMIVAWWIGPLVIFLIRRESKFVKFHALQALLWQILLVVLWFFCFIGMIAFMILLGVPGAEKLPRNDVPWPIFIVFFFFYGVIMLLVLLNLVLGIVFGIKAGRGKWADYPLLGRLARRILHMPLQGPAAPHFEPPAAQI
ncbi:MAG TPA: DUF4870 domain-containing protein [Verrucomicrobiae bacterium]|nr:DUF4870 domain-containing protein [Verrucomicrobiae bacterium]